MKLLVAPGSDRGLAKASFERTATGTPVPLSRDFAAKQRKICRKTGSVMCAGHGASNERQ
jgi:hypothetical protein